MQLSEIGVIVQEKSKLNMAVLAVRSESYEQLSGQALRGSSRRSVSYKKGGHDRFVGYIHYIISNQLAGSAQLDKLQHKKNPAVRTPYTKLLSILNCLYLRYLRE